MSTFINRTAIFQASVHVFTDTMAGLMAAGIENKMKTSGEVPLLPKSTKYAQRGALRASIRHRKMGDGHYVVTAGEGSPAAAYAAAQEAGMTRGRQIKNYSTSGTGAHWFQHAIDNVKSRQPEYAEAAKLSAGMENY